MCKLEHRIRTKLRYTVSSFLVPLTLSIRTLQVDVNCLMKCPAETRMAFFSGMFFSKGIFFMWKIIETGKKHLRSKQHHFCAERSSEMDTIIPIQNMWLHTSVLAHVQWVGQQESLFQGPLVSVCLLFYEIMEFSASSNLLESRVAVSYTWKFSIIISRCVAQTNICWMFQ